jgi:hypothetical protein
MTNIWAQSFEEVRRPFFEMEDPYTLSEKKASKDYDGDGKIESGAKEYRGSIHNAIQKKKGGKPDGQDTSSVKEDVEQIDELSVNKMHAYVNKAKKDRGRLNKKWDQGTATYREKSRALGREEGEERASRQIKKKTGKDAYRINTLDKLKSAITKEEVLDEAQYARNNPEKYEREQDKKYAPVRGERTPMPPRGNKRREDFEKWYRANVKEDYIGEVNDSKETKLDVRKGIKNKIVISPQVKEEVGEWVAELVEEGYDLSEFTWDEMTNIYLSEGTAGMPARGDAETVSATNPQLASAKRRAAQAQISADMARIKLQKASAMTKESFDSIVEYLSQRDDVFENLEEAVFDPKKSRLNPASQRTQRVMTDAQRKAANKEASRVANIHSKGETVLAGMRPSKTTGKVKTTSAPKSEPPKANRTVKGRYDRLAKAADHVLKDIRNK